MENYVALVRIKPDYAMFIKPALLAIQQYGITTDALLSRISPRASELKAGDFALRQTIQELIDVGIQLSGDHLFGLRAGSCARAEHLGLLGILARCTSSLHEAYKLLRRYSYYFQEIEFPLRLQERTSSGELEIQYISASATSSPAMSEYVMYMLLTCIPRVSGWECNLKKIKFRHAPSEPLKNYRDYFSVPVIFEADANALVILDPENRPFDDSNPAMLEDLKNLFGEISTNDALAPGGIVEKVGAYIHAEMHRWRPDEAAIARKLNISPSTLRRMLTLAGSSFREVLDRSLFQIAAAALIDDGLTVNRIAEKLHYSDTASFHRAFKRWTGLTPSQYIHHLNGNSGVDIGDQ